MQNSSLKQLAAALASRRISSVELTRLFLDRVEALNPALNAFITVDAARIEADCAVAPENRCGNPSNPLCRGI